MNNMNNKLDEGIIDSTGTINTIKECLKEVKDINMRIVSQAMLLYKTGHNADAIASLFGLDVDNVRRMICGFRMFDGVNDNLTTHTIVENDRIANNLIEKITGSDDYQPSDLGLQVGSYQPYDPKPSGWRYPYLRYLLLKDGSDILCNQVMKERNGNPVTRFDIVIPCLKTIIINTDTMEAKDDWYRKIGDINEFHSYLGHIGCEGLFFIHQGIDRILQTLEKVAGFYVDVQCYGQKTGFPEELLGLD